MQACLTEGKITAEDGPSASAERLRQRDEEWSVAVRSRTVCQSEAIPIRIDRRVQEASNGYSINSIKKRSTVVVHA